ncbi:MAG: hypothetical protein ACRENB_10675, partial [Gemmatimonadales bacterium]
RRLSPGEGVLGALILLSPSVLLGVERANGDLLLFLLVLGAALLVARGGARLAGGLGLVFAGAMLKLYPIAAAASALLHRRGWRIVVVTVALFAVYAAATRNDIRRVSAATPRPVHLAYGSAVLPTAWAARVAQRDPGTMNRLRPWVRVARWGVPAVLLGIAVLLSPRSGPVELSSDAAGAAFLAGAGIYGLTYVLGNNWDYRLIFLILCLPMLWQWGRREDASGTWSVLILGSMAASFWLGPSDRRIWFVDEIFNAVAWLGLAVLTLAWLRARRASA